MSATASEKRHLARLAELPCALCEAQPVEVHHILEGRIKGRRSGAFTAIPLCPDCHRHSLRGIHGRKDMLRIMKKTELELLAETLEKLFGRAR